MKPSPTLVCAIVCALAIYGAGKAISEGVINLGGGRATDFFVSYAEQPGLFSFGIVSLLVIAALCAWYVWREWAK